jgi:hypothetical protein
MLKEGYEKVIRIPFSILPHVELTTTLLLDKTRLIQSRQSS